MSVWAGSEIVDIAKQVEELGEAFYEEALKHLKDARIRRIFAFLRDEERRHAGLFEAMLSGLKSASVEWREDEQYLTYMRALARNHVFPDREAVRVAVQDLRDEAAAIRIALGFEKDSILFLHELRVLVREEDRNTVDQLIAEEREHVRTLQELLDRSEAAGKSGPAP
jgi:rubrerythrin